MGMLPPPVGGQAVMFERAVAALREHAAVDVVDIQAQRNIGESGAFRLGKLGFVAGVVLRRIAPLFGRERYDVLYYCPAGPNTLGLLKDIVFLALLRRLARRTVYHFHATGSGAFIAGRSAPLRALARRVLFAPDLAIRCAAVEPNDAEAYGASAARVVPNGVEDPAMEVGPRRPPVGRRPILLTFAGALVEDKGLYDLLDVVEGVRRRGHDAHLELLGEGLDAETTRFDALAARRGLGEVVRRRGVLTGRERDEALARTDVFVFPSFFRAETQPLAVIEAHAMGVPVVAYDWRGLGTIVDEGRTGYLVPVRDTAAFAERVARLIEEGTIADMGARARRRYEERFGLERFASELRDAVLSAAAAGAA